MNRHHVLGPVLLACAVLRVGHADAGEVGLAPAGPATVTPLLEGSFRVEVTPRSALPLPTTWVIEPSVTLGWRVVRVGPGGLPAVAQDLAYAERGAPLPTLSFVVWPDPSLNAPAEAVGHVVLQIRYRETHGRTMPWIERYYFRVDGGSPVQSSFNAYKDALETKTVRLDGKDFPVFVVKGAAMEADEAVRNLPPWDNPELPEEVRLEASARAGRPVPAGIDAQTGALTGPEADAGCSTSGGSAAGLGLLLSPGLVVFAIGGLRRDRSAARVLVGLALASATTMSAVPAMAETRTVYGYVSFWDTREGMHDETGCRRPTCDTGYTTCNPSWGWDCCFTGIPRVTLYLMRGLAFVDEVQTSATGWYMMSDANWRDTDYYLVVAFTRTGYPATFRIAGDGDSPSYYVFLVGDPIRMTGAYTYIPNRAVKNAGDTTSFNGDVASAWRTADDAFMGLEGEGETRHRREYGSANSYDQIKLRYYDLPSGAGFSYCDDSMVEVDVTRGRTMTPGHELGHQYHGRVVGCSGDAPSFPPYHGDLAWRWDGAEGASIPEALAGFTAMVSRWDTAIPGTNEVIPDWAPCATELHDPAFYADYDNSNDVASMRNNELAFWEFIDTSTTGADAHADYFDITLKALMDSLLTLKNTPGSQGQNRTANEQYFVDQSDYCDDAMDCDPGEVCKSHDCKAGDPHGGNLRDWIYHLAIDLGRSDLDAWKTLQSSPCVGTGDDSYPFRGGYRMD
ncbi:MAG: hypothetical protein FJ087_20430 [Deltaproteobacteria bacterium]|nr:hypothetical protein [Deltaproteobacteria bacterium]